MESASEELQTGLQTLQIATERDLQTCRGRVRRLASGLPAFDSVWIDALVEQKLLTPFQAQYFEQKNWSDLEVNSEIVLQDQFYFDQTMPMYRACLKNSPSQFFVTRFEINSASQQAFKRLSGLIEWNRAQENVPALATEFHFNKSRSTVDLISPFIEGETLNGLLIRRGRFPEEVVRLIAIEICRQLDERGSKRLHGDLRLANILLTRNGQVVLLNTGVLTSLMPTLNIHQKLPADAYDGLAPERFESSQEVSVASEMYALGCLIWHLLAGRPPQLLADPLEKIAAHRQQNIKDVREYVPDCSPELAELILSMTSRRPLARPQAFTDIIEVLEPGRFSSRSRIQQFLESFESSAPRRTTPTPTKKSHRLLKTTVAAILTILVLGLFWRRNEFGLPELSQVAASTSSSDEEFKPISSLEERPVKTASLETDVPESVTNVPSDQIMINDLPLPNDEGIIQLTHAGPYSFKQIRHEEKIVIRNLSPVIPTILIKNSDAELIAPHVELSNLDVEFASESDIAASSLIVKSKEFRMSGCSLRHSSSTTNQTLQTALIQWSNLNQDNKSGGRLLIANCINLSSRTLISTKSPISTVLFENVLQNSDGALLRLDAGVQAGMKVPVVFNSCTHSSAAAAIQIVDNSNLRTGGKLSIQGSNSILAVGHQIPLIEFLGETETHDDLQRHLEISAHGLIVHREAVLFGKQGPGLSWHSIEANQVQVDGVLSGLYEFASSPTTNDEPELLIPELIIQELPLRSTTELPGFQLKMWQQARHRH